MNTKKTIPVIFFSLIFISAATLITLAQETDPSYPEFNGEIALSHIEHQLSLGPRTPGSPGHAQIITWLHSELEGQGWQVEPQETEFYGQKMTNIIARRGSTDHDRPWYLLGAHYDTRFFADNDPNPDNHSRPVPGANDGASGVAVLLELARTIPEDYPGEIWLVFFDAEDNGRIEGWDWILGSRAFVDHLEIYPDAAIIVDMIADSDLNIFLEKNSNQVLAAEIWEQAALLGYHEYFIPEFKYSILDDHTAFLQAGISAVDIIDFDYPFWHTREDTLDKVSADSLQIVGDTLLAWLQSKRE
jgi:glutaminyl-peptide cyclotransferase